MTKPMIPGHPPGYTAPTYRMGKWSDLSPSQKYSQYLVAAPEGSSHNDRVRVIANQYGNASAIDIANMIAIADREGVDAVKASANNPSATREEFELAKFKFNALEAAEGRPITQGPNYDMMVAFSKDSDDGKRKRLMALTGGSPDELNRAFESAYGSVNVKAKDELLSDYYGSDERMQQREGWGEDQPKERLSYEELSDNLHFGVRDDGGKFTDSQLERFRNQLGAQEGLKKMYEMYTGKPQDWTSMNQKFDTLPWELKASAYNAIKAPHGQKVALLKEIGLSDQYLSNFFLGHLDDPANSIPGYNSMSPEAKAEIDKTNSSIDQWRVDAQNEGKSGNILGDVGSGFEGAAETMWNVGDQTAAKIAFGEKGSKVLESVFRGVISYAAGRGLSEGWQALQSVPAVKAAMAGTGAAGTSDSLDPNYVPSSEGTGRPPNYVPPDTVNYADPRTPGVEADMFVPTDTTNIRPPDYVSPYGPTTPGTTTPPPSTVGPYGPTTPGTAPPPTTSDPSVLDNLMSNFDWTDALKLGLPSAASLYGTYTAAEAAKDAAATQAAGAENAAQLQADAQAAALQAIEEGKTEALGYYDEFMPQYRSAVAGIPGEVTPIYDQGYTDLDVISEGQYGAMSDVYQGGVNRARNQVGGGYDESGRRLGAYGDTAGDIIAEGRTLAEQPLMGGYGRGGDIMSGYGTDAQAAIRAGMTAAGDPLAAGYDRATQALTGYGSEAERALAEGMARAEDPLASGYGQAQDIYGQTLAGATGAYSPYSQAGVGALQQMAGMTADPLSDPLFERRVERTQAQAAEALGAMGLSGSGKRVLEEAGIYDEMAREQVQRADMARQTLAQMGYGAAGAEANLYADIGTRRAASAADLGSQVGAMRERGVGQELGYMGDVARGTAGYEAGRGRDVSGVYERGAGRGVDVMGDVARATTGLETGLADRLAAGRDISTGQRLQVLGDVERTRAAQDVSKGATMGDLSMRGTELQAGALQDLYSQRMQQRATRMSDEARLAETSARNLADLYGTEMAARAAIASGTAQPRANIIQSGGSNAANIAIGAANAAAAAQQARSGVWQSGLSNLANIGTQYASGAYGTPFWKNEPAKTPAATNPTAPKPNSFALSPYPLYG